MACLKVQGPNYIRIIAESHDKNVRGVLPTEKIIGSIMDCGPQDPPEDFDSLVTYEGLMLGNVVKKVTNALGIKQCLACKGRQRALNEKGLALQRKLRDLV